MIRVVLDTNVLVSALLKTKGNEASLLNLVTGRHVQLCISEPIVAEYAEVLSGRKLRLDPIRVQHVLALVRREGVLVTPTNAVRESRDEPDNRFLECAEAAEAAYLVTGNAKHFPQTHKKTRIVTGRRFLDILAESEKE
jgi:putative PIN family toxin of toxin-antitoxin system